MKFVRLLLLVFICSRIGIAQVPKVEQLAGFIEIALKDNPKIEAAIHRANSAEKIIPQAGALPDPQLTLGLMNLPVNSFDFDQEPMTGKLVSVMQMFPFPGKLGFSADMAEFETQAARFRQQEISNQIVSMVKKVYYDLYVADRAIEIVQANQALVQQFVSVAETKYATGSGLQQDVLRAQLELSKMEDDLIMWQQKRKVFEAKLNALVNSPAHTRIDNTRSELPLPEDVLVEVELEKIERARPLLLAWKEMLNKADIAVKLASRDYWPNFTVGASYSQRDNLKNGATMHDFFSATVSLNIPLYFNRKQKPKVQQKQFDLVSLQSEYEAVRNDVLAEIEGIRAELVRNQKRVDLYKEGILLQAQQSLESALAGYQVGKVDFITLINNWMLLQNYELQFYRALADYWKASASYEFALGRDLIQE